MSREQLVEFTLKFLRAYAPAREWGGLKAEAEEIVDDYLRKGGAL